MKPRTNAANLGVVSVGAHAYVVRYQDGMIMVRRWRRRKVYQLDLPSLVCAALGQGEFTFLGAGASPTGVAVEEAKHERLQVCC